MFTLPSAVQVFVCLQAIDLRKSFDSLAALTTSVIQQDPLSGHLFVFLSKRRDRVKILFWDRSGYCLYYKRLEVGTFTLPGPVGEAVGALSVDLPELTLMLEGINLLGATQRRRFTLEKNNKYRFAT